MANPYVKQTWVDNNVSNPTSAARMGVLETGIFDAHYKAAVRVTHNANQSLTTATLTALAFNTEIIDQESNAASTMHDTVTNNSRLTCRTAGVYEIKGNIAFAANANGRRAAQIRHQGATVIAQTSMMAITADGPAGSEILVSTLYPMAVNEYVELMAYQSSGGALNAVVGANYAPIFSMVRVA